jgi:SRSO17 transposase
MLEAAVADDLTGEAPALLLVTAQDVEACAEEFAAYHAHFAPFYARREQRAWAEIYLRGLLVADVPRKNVEAIALRLCGAGAHARRTVRALQQFLGEGAWDDAALLAEHQRLVAETLGEDDGVLLVDGSDVAKQGTHSVGVARQWCGSTGKKDNCQAGVYLGYASRKGYTLLDRRLYLHETWFAEDHRERWKACAIPDDVPFQTKPHLAATMVEGVMQAHRLRARWLACDEGYGQDPVFLDRVAACGLWYMAEVPKATHVWPLVEPATGEERARPTLWVPPQVASRKGPVPTTPRLHPQSPPAGAVAQIAAQLPSTAWHRYRLLEGSKGPLVADFAALRAVAVRDRLPGPEVWLLLRRPLPPGESGPEEDRELKYYLSCAPSETPLAALVRVSGFRWPIEACFAEGNEEVGLDHYETRFWRGWHHHMTLVILAHHFLVRMQARLHQRGGACTNTATAAHRAPAAALRTAGVPGPSGGLDPADADAAAAAQSSGSARPAMRGVTAAPPRRGCGPGSGALPPAVQSGRLSLSPQAPVAPA